MASPEARSILYRLIEAGQLTRRALLAPLLDRGLEPGDDAVLFALHAQPGCAEAGLAEALGVPAEALAGRLARLVERELVAPQPAAGDGPAGLVLTERGERIRELLSANWRELEGALLGELAPKQRRTLNRVLKRFVALLRL